MQMSMIGGRFPIEPYTDPPFNPRDFVLDLNMMIGMQVALFLSQLIAMSAVAVSIHRAILFGDMKPGVWFNFPFGATEMRFLAMGLLFALMTICVIALLVGPALFLVSGGDIVGFFSDWQTKGPEAMQSGGIAVLIGAYLVGWLTVLFLLVRLSVWPPSVVASGRLSPAEPWRLTRGNFWNLIGLFILVGATLYAMFIPVGIAVAVFFAMRFPVPQQGQTLTMTPEKVFEMVQPMLPFAAALYFIVIVFVTGVTVAVLSYAYKALKGVDAKAPMAEG